MSSNRSSWLFQFSRLTIGNSGNHVDATLNQVQENIQKDVSRTEIADMRQQSSDKHRGFVVRFVSSVSVSSNFDLVQENI